MTVPNTKLGGLTEQCLDDCQAVKEFVFRQNREGEVYVQPILKNCNLNKLEGKKY